MSKDDPSPMDAYFQDITPKPERPLNRRERAAWAAAVRRANRQARRKERRNSVRP